MIITPRIVRNLGTDINSAVGVNRTRFAVDSMLAGRPSHPLDTFSFNKRMLVRRSNLTTAGLLNRHDHIHCHVRVTNSTRAVTALGRRLRRALIVCPSVELSSVSSRSARISHVSSGMLVFLGLLIVTMLLLSTITVCNIVATFIAGRRTGGTVHVTVNRPIGRVGTDCCHLLLAASVVTDVTTVILDLKLLRVNRPCLSTVLPTSVNLTVGPVDVIGATVVTVLLAVIVARHNLDRLDAAAPTALLGRNTDRTTTSRS